MHTALRVQSSLTSGSTHTSKCVIFRFQNRLEIQEATNRYSQTSGRRLFIHSQSLGCSTGTEFVISTSIHPATHLGSVTGVLETIPAVLGQRQCCTLDRLPLGLMFMSWDCGRKPEHHERAHKHRANSKSKGPRKATESKATAGTTKFKQINNAGPKRITLPLFGHLVKTYFTAHLMVFVSFVLFFAPSSTHSTGLNI